MLKKNITANFITQLYSILGGIIVVPLLLKALGSEAYGIIGFYTLLQAWSGLLDLGLSPTISREVSKFMSNDSQNDDKNKFISFFHSVEIIFIVIGLLIGLGIFILKNWILNSWLNIGSIPEFDVSVSLIIIGSILSLRFLNSFYNGVLIGAEDLVWLSYLNVFLTTMRNFGVLIVLYFINSSLVAFFLFQLFIVLIGLAYIFKRTYLVLKIKYSIDKFDLESIKSKIPFAASIAYTGIIWLFLGQFDKLLFSNILPIDQFGYFTIVATVSNLILLLIGPIMQAIEPRMVSLVHIGKINEMLTLYKKSTQWMCVLIFSFSGMIAIYGYELLFLWTGNLEISKWGSEVLKWYTLGNGILAVSGFQHGLQYAYGNLKLHVYYNTFFAILAIPLIWFVSYQLGPLGAAKLWFALRCFGFLFWVPYIHYKFAKGIHLNWIRQDIIPTLLTSIIYLSIVYNINFEIMNSGSRILGFVKLILIGTIMLLFNALSSSEFRTQILIFFKKNHKFN